MASCRSRDNDRITGIACLKKLRENVCEIKRLYVQPVSRGMGLGKLLLEKLIEHAKDCGYTRIFLDSDPYMENAHAMYRSLGFVEIPPYPEAEMSGNDYVQHMVFMELVLEAGKG